MIEKISGTPFGKWGKKKYSVCLIWLKDKAELIRYISKTYFNQNARNVLYKVGFILGLIWLVKQNWSLMTNYNEIVDREGFLNAIQTPANLFVFKFGLIYALATAAYFLFRLPFQRIESLKVGSGGLEYKVASENAKVADATLTNQRKAENVRLNILDTISSPNVLNTAKKLANKDEISMVGGITLIANIIQANLLSSLNIKIEPSIVGVVNNVPDPGEYDNLKVNVQLLINEISNSEKPWLIQEGRHNYIISRFKWQKTDTDYCVLYLEADSAEWKFSKADYLLLDTAWNIIKSSLELYSKKNSVIIVTKGQAMNQGGGAK